MKGLAYGKFIRRAQNWQKTCDHEKRISWPVLGQNKIFQNPVVSLFLLFFLSIFGLSIFLGILWLFPFISLIFFLHLGAQKSNNKKYELKQVKGVACGNFRKVFKIDKNLVTTKRGCCDHFLTKIKIFDPSKAGDGWIRNFFLIDFDIWNIKIWVRMWKLDQFYELTLN